MTDKLLIDKLFSGCYIKKRHGRNSKYAHGLYTADKLLIAQVSVKQYSRFALRLKCNNGKYTLNLNAVRKMHGNALPKRRYRIKTAQQQ